MQRLVRLRHSLRNARRIVVDAATEARIEAKKASPLEHPEYTTPCVKDLQAGHYVVNVVARTGSDPAAPQLTTIMEWKPSARSLATGHVVAYQPWVGDLGDSVRKHIRTVQNPCTSAARPGLLLSRTTGAVADRKASSGPAAQDTELTGLDSQC